MDLWKIGGSTIGGIAGFIFGGPIGAAVGSGVGWFGGGFLEKEKPKLGSWGGIASPFSPPVPADKKTAVSVQPMPAVKPADPTVITTAATAMNTAIGTHGYKLADQPLYMAFQRVAGLKADGLPGPSTMTKLNSVLQTAGIAAANVKVYPWGPSGYDGINAPTMQEWTGNQAWSGPPPTVANTPLPAASQVAGAIPVAPGSTVTTNQDVQRALNTLGYAKPPLNADGVIGPLSIAAIKGFQAHSGLAVDGIPGANTKTALQNALAALAPSTATTS